MMFYHAPICTFTLFLYIPQLYHPSPHGTYELTSNMDMTYMSWPGSKTDRRTGEMRGQDRQVAKEKKKKKRQGKENKTRTEETLPGQQSLWNRGVRMAGNDMYNNKPTKQYKKSIWRGREGGRVQLGKRTWTGPK